MSADYDTETKLSNGTSATQGLSGAATAAHFHGPAGPDEVAGPVVPVPLEAGTTAEPVAPAAEPATPTEAPVTAPAEPPAAEPMEERQKSPQSKRPLKNHPRLNRQHPQKPSRQPPPSGVLRSRARQH